MSDFQHQRQSDMYTLQHMTGLSEAYLKLEGFLDEKPSENSAVSTLADSSVPTTQKSEQSWIETFVTFSMLFTYLVVISMALGFGVSKLSQGLQQLSNYVYQQSIDSAAAPTKWHW